MINNRFSKRLALCAVVLVAVFLAGCLAFPSSPVGTPLPIAPTCSPSPVPSPTLEPPTSVPSPSPVPAARTPILTRTPPSPTLTADEEYAYVQDMLTTNGGCELPCWWGITPGESSWQDANDRFPYLNFQFQFPEELGDYDVHLTLTEEGGLVQFIEARGYCFPDDCDRFAQDWARYSLDQVLSRYGAPSRARIALVLPVEPGGPIYYILYVFYDDLGVGLRYMGPAVAQGEVLRTCFSFEDITLWLQSPESSTPLEHAIGPDEWSFAVPLDEATGMSVEEFYETFRQPGACLEAPPTFQ